MSCSSPGPVSPGCFVLQVHISTYCAEYDSPSVACSIVVLIHYRLLDFQEQIRRLDDELLDLEVVADGDFFLGREQNGVVSSSTRVSDSEFYANTVATIVDPKDTGVFRRVYIIGHPRSS